MEHAQPGMIFYNYNPVDGTITPGNTPVHVDIGSLDIARQINQQVHLQYNNGNVQAIQAQGGPQIILTQTGNQSAVPIQTERVEIAEEQVAEVVLPKVSKPRMKSNNGERVPCQHCGKTFSCNANLRDHLRLHTGERPFQCTECGMSFAQRSNWRLHKRVHTGERPYMCGICGKTFARSSHMPGHVRVHTGERPFHCQECKQSFASAQALKNHSRTHTGEKPYICDVCQTPFTHSSSLSSHKKRCTGQKRKRGRPLSTSRVYVVKKAPSVRSRGRPKRKKSRRGKKKVEEAADLKGKNEGGKEVTDDCLKSPIKLEHNFNINETVCISDAVSISVDSFTNANSSELSEDFVEPNQFESVSILPDSKHATKTVVVQGSIPLPRFDEQVDLKQEAAVTMATLHDSVVKLVHIPPEEHEDNS